MDEGIEWMRGEGYSPRIRITERAWLLDIAATVSERGTCSRLRVGAIIVRDGRILSTGYNGAPVGMPHCEHPDDKPCTISVHAEVNAVIFAARHGVSTEGAEIYVTHAPCWNCSGLLINAGIRRVTFRNYYRSEDGLDRLSYAGIESRYGYVDAHPAAVA